MLHIAISYSSIDTASNPPVLEHSPPGVVYIKAERPWTLVVIIAYQESEPKYPIRRGRRIKTILSYSGDDKWMLMMRGQVDIWLALKESWRRISF